jgi:hypothetical protein
MHVMGKDIMEWATAKLHETLDIIANAEEKVDYGTGWGDYTVIEKPDWL